jgi:hypothetical protein
MPTAGSGRRSFQHELVADLDSEAPVHRNRALQRPAGLLDGAEPNLGDLLSSAVPALDTSLIEASQAWAIERGCTAIEIETQHINVAARRFYARMAAPWLPSTASPAPTCPERRR